MSEQDDTHFDTDRLLVQIRIGIANLLVLAGILFGTIAVAARQAVTVGADPAVMLPVYLAALFGAVAGAVCGATLLLAEELDRAEHWLQAKWTSIRGPEPNFDDPVTDGGDD